MKIPIWTWIVGALSVIGILWTGFKNIRDIGTFLSTLNGWAVLAILSAVGLMFALISYVEWLNSRFENLRLACESADTKLREDMKTGFSNETGSRAGVHSYINIELQKVEARLNKIEKWFNLKDVKP
jgi:hypothetical protein